MPNALVLTAPHIMTSPPPGTPVLKVRGDTIVLASDSFNSPDGPSIPRTMDAAQGGPRSPWSSSESSALVIKNNTLSPSTTGGAVFYYLDSPGAGARDLEISVRLASLPVDGSFFLDLFRTSPSSSSQKIRLAVNVGGSCSIQVAAGGSAGTAVVPGANFTVDAGDRISLRVNSSTKTASYTKNGVRSVPFPLDVPFPLTGSLLGLGFGGIAASVDDLVIRETLL